MYRFYELVITAQRQALGARQGLLKLAGQSVCTHQWSLVMCDTMKIWAFRANSSPLVG